MPDNIKIEYVAIDALQPAEYNPRKANEKQTDQLERNMREFGFIDPVIANSAPERKNVIIGGHFRVRIAKKIGMDTVPVVYVNIPDIEKEKELNVRLNKNTGDFDFEKLANFFEINDLLDWGFSSNELLGVFEDDEDPRKAAADELPEITKEAFVSVGDVFLCGRHKVLCGDCTLAQDVQTLMGDDKAELLFTSPPYSDMRTYNGNKDLSVEHLSLFIENFSKYCSYMAVNLGIQRKDHEVFQYWDGYISRAKQNKLKLLSWNIWAKQSAGSIGNQTAFFPITHEWIFVFGTEFKHINRTWEKKTHTKKVLTNKTDKDGKKGKTTAGFQGDLKEMETVFFLNTEMERDIGHPAVFPWELPFEYIKAMTDPDDIIVDPFLGSGSSLIATEKAGRILYGIELDPFYMGVILNRYKTFTNIDPIRQSDGKAWSEICG